MENRSSSIEYATTLVELGLYPLDNIKILPQEQPDPSLSKDVVDIVQDEASKSISIYTNNHSSKRLEFLADSPKGSPYRALLSALDLEFGRYRIAQALQSRKRILGGWLEVNGCTSKRQALDYYKSMITLLGADCNLIALCLEAIVECPIIVQRQEDRPYVYTDPHCLDVSDYVLNSNWRLAGTHNAVHPHYHLKLGPLTTEHSVDFLPGSQARVFLEEKVIPTFFPRPATWGIELLFTQQLENWVLSSEKNSVRVEINTMI